MPNFIHVCTLVVLLYLPYTGFLLIWYCTRMQTINKETNKHIQDEIFMKWWTLPSSNLPSDHSHEHQNSHALWKGHCETACPENGRSRAFAMGTTGARVGDVWWRDWVVGRVWGEEGEWVDGSDWGRRRRDQSVRWEGYRGRTKGRTRSERNGRDWEGNQFESNAHQMARTTQTIATISHYLDSPRYHLFPFTICSNVFSPKEDFCL